MTGMWDQAYYYTNCVFKRFFTTALYNQYRMNMYSTKSVCLSIPLIGLTQYTNTEYLPSHPSTIHSQRMPTHIRPGLTRQKHHRALEILRRAPPARRYPLTDALQPLGVIQ